MSDWKPGIFQTYPQAIQGLLIGLTASVMLISGVVWMFTHPTTVIQIYAWAGFGIFALVTMSTWDSTASGASKTGKVVLCVAFLVLAVRAVL